MVALRVVDASDRGLIAALAEAGLPEPGAGRYFGATQYGALVGYAGLGSRVHDSGQTHRTGGITKSDSDSNIFH